MDTRHIALVQQSYEAIAGFGERLAEQFYAELFAIDPSLRAMFDGDIRRQYMKFMMMLALIVRSLDDPDKIAHTTENLAIKHVGYGVQPKHFTPFGNALLRTIKKALGPDYTRDVAEAWEESFRMLARIMKRAELYVGIAERKSHRREQPEE